MNEELLKNRGGKNFAVVVEVAAIVGFILRILI